MATVLTDNKNYASIASAIREKGGTDKKYTPAEMPAGVSEVYEKGKKDMADSWWKQIYAEGYSTRLNFNSAFQEFDFSEVGGFNPQDTIKPSWARDMFYKCSGLKKVTKEQIDFTCATDLYRTFYNSDIEEIEYFYPYSCDALTKTFAYCYSLHTIGTLCLLTDSERGSRYDYSYTFDHTSALKNINKIVGTFRGSVSFANSPLTLESAVRVIMALGSSSELYYAHTVSFAPSVWKKLEENPPSSMGIDTDAPDWKSYIINKKWWNYS